MCHKKLNKLSVHSIFFCHIVCTRYKIAKKLISRKKIKSYKIISLLRESQSALFNVHGY